MFIRNYYVGSNLLSRKLVLKWALHTCPTLIVDLEARFGKSSFFIYIEIGSILNVGVPNTISNFLLYYGQYNYIFEVVVFYSRAPGILISKKLSNSFIVGESSN